MSLRAAVSARDALDGARTAIAAGGSESAPLDAELLLAHALGVTRERLIIDRDLVVTGEAVRRFQSHVRRRSVDREPVAYIVGRRAFRRLELTVDARVLVPRPETELLVEIGCELDRGARVLDCCTGSGAVALALKDERDDLRVSGSDLSDAALSVARANAERLGLYVAWQRAEIARHEPALALDGGKDGLELIRRLVAQAARADIKLLAIEHGGEGQADAVADLCDEAGFSAIERRRDLAGQERVIVARLVM